MALTVTSPAAGSTQAGAFTFSVDTSGVPNVAAIEYLFCGKKIFSPVAAAPYQQLSHADYFANGTFAVSAIAYDASNRVLATAPEVSFTIQRFSGGGITLNSPSNLANLSGVVAFHATVVYPVGHQPDRVQVSLDGKQIQDSGGNWSIFTAGPIDFSVDTSKLQNGAHEISIASFAGSAGDATPTPGPTFAGLNIIRFTTANGSAQAEIRCNRRWLFMAPGDTWTLGVRNVNADGSESITPAGGLLFSSAVPTVATVSASGLVTATGPGRSLITVLSGGFSCGVNVQVDPAHAGLKHFTSDGLISSVYTPGKSVIMRTMFFLDIDNAVGNDPNVGTAMQQAQLNTFTRNIYFSPAELGNPPTYAAWQTIFDNNFNGSIGTASQFGMKLFFTGDDMDGNNSALHDALNDAYGTQAIQHAFTKAKNSGLALGVDMIDEAALRWGDTPFPTDTRWDALSPSVAGPSNVPRDAFRQLLSEIAASNSAIPMSFPVSGQDSFTAAANWMGTASPSTYCSNYLGLIGDLNTGTGINQVTYPWGPSGVQIQGAYDYQFLQRSTTFDRTAPQVGLVGVTWHGYFKRVAGSSFTPGSDTIGQRGFYPSAVPLQVGYFMARHFVGIRAYAYDGPNNGNFWYHRSTDALDTGTFSTSQEQTGASPNFVGLDRWAALSAGCRMVAAIERHLLQAPAHAIDAGKDVLCGAKSGADSNVLILVNLMETPRTVVLDLSPYTTNSASVSRHRVQGTFYTNDSFARASSFSETLQPQETVVYIFPKTPVPSVVFSNLTTPDVSRVQVIGQPREFSMVLTSANSFVPTANMAFDHVEVSISAVPSELTGALVATLYGDAGGQPGTVLETLPLTAAGNVYTGTSLTRPALASGTQYWLGLSTSTASDLGGWNIAAGDSGLRAESVAGIGGPWTVRTDERAAFRIWGS